MKRILITVFALAFAFIAQAQTPDFTDAAAKSVNAVVHVKVKITEQQTNSFGNPFGDDPFFQFFFGQPQQRQMPPQQATASGSGVIISSDGYIATNNHVVDKATEVEVILNDKRTFTATVVGTDPSTDLALLKVDENNLPTLSFGNSDELKVGEWVLAVGNPFNLTSTVTAGIVSAKARNINILSADMKIESFIQTDAAVNPGNSGGALVNTKGELVGINTAIATQTGSYTGYSFAIPSSIVQKVISDLRQHGVVQRAVLGVSISDITDAFAKEKKLNILSGAYVHSVVEGGSAADAGIKEGDVITAINNKQVNSVSELQEQIALHAPGDKVSVTVMRGKDTKTFSVSLKNRRGDDSALSATSISSLGASLAELDKEQLAKLNIANGIQVASVVKDGKFDKADIKKGFIIRRVNNQTVYKVSDIEQALKQVSTGANADNALFISGSYPDGRRGYYAVPLN